VNTAFVESRVFTIAVNRLGLEEDLRRLQWQLHAHPDAGVIEPGTGGLRKIRLGRVGRGIGKRGGIRIHYLWLPTRGVVYLLNLYAKNESASLTAIQKKQLRRLAALLKQEVPDAP